MSAKAALWGKDLAHPWFASELRPGHGPLTVLDVSSISIFAKGATHTVTVARWPVVFEARIGSRSYDSLSKQSWNIKLGVGECCGSDQNADDAFHVGRVFFGVVPGSVLEGVGSQIRKAGGSVPVVIDSRYF